MDVHVQFAEEDFAAIIDGRVVDGSLATEGSDEVLHQESIAGDRVHLRWDAGAANGDQAPMSGWVEQHRQSEESRFRCFDGEVIVRTDYFGALYYVFAADVLYEATVDGTCGAPTTDEVAFGCLPDDY